MKHTATLKEHELTWNMMNQVWELTAIIEIDGKDMQLYVPLSEYPRRMYIKLYEENKQLKELLRDCRFMLREMSDVNNWLEGDDCELNYYMATECGKYVTKIDNAIGEDKCMK